MRPTFEDSIDCINIEIRKRKVKWNLTALAWLDFEDVSQILRIHIYKKWDQYDSSQPLAPWINRIITNQIKNLVRNNYSSYSRPCLGCAAAELEDSCRIFGKQCSDCPIYAKWEKTKKSAYDTKLPVALELHSQEVYSLADNNLDIEKCAEIIHSKMREVLKPIELKVYTLLFMDYKNEAEVAKIMGYKTTEQNRKPGYKQIKNIRKSIIAKVKKHFASGEIDIG